VLKLSYSALLRLLLEFGGALLTSPMQKSNIYNDRILKD
jgi:hypothetical protein